MAKKPETEIKILPIEQLTANPVNPREIKYDQFEKLVNSIKEFPEMLKIRPIVIGKENVVLGGNMRLRACIEAGMKEVPTINISDWSQARQNEFIIKDNISFGEWDFELLANDWNIEDLEKWGLNLPIDFGDGMADIQQVTDFSEGVNFNIKCATLEDLNILKSKLGVTGNKIQVEKFYEILENLKNA